MEGLVKSRDDDDGSAGGGEEARPHYVLPREDVKVFGGVTAYKQLLFIRDTIGLGWVIQKHPLLANCKKALNFVMLVSSEVSLIMVPVCTVLIAT